MHLLVQIGINAFYGGSNGAPRTLEHAPDPDLVIFETSLRDRCPNDTIWKQVHHSFWKVYCFPGKRKKLWRHALRATPCRVFARRNQARGGQARILYDDPQTLKSYINPSQCAQPLVGTFSSASFFVARRVDLQPCLELFRIQIVHQTNARVRKCTCDCKCPKRTFLDNYAPFSPVVNIWNVAQWYLLRIFLISLGPCRAKRIF